MIPRLSLKSIIHFLRFPKFKQASFTPFLKKKKKIQIKSHFTKEKNFTILMKRLKEKIKSLTKRSIHPKKKKNPFSKPL